MIVSSLLSLQVLISAVSDLLTKLMETDGVPSYILRDYIQFLTPSKTEWEEMRESLSFEVCICDHKHYIMTNISICSLAGQCNR